MKLAGINQLWVADMTYIRLRREFVFLAVVLDGFSRKVVASPVSGLASRTAFSVRAVGIATARGAPIIFRRSLDIAY
jgi:transposase InsO family protein